MGSFSPMRPTILVTGATGALGRHLIGELRSSGYQVRCQYRTRSGTVEGPNWQGMDFLESLDFSALVAGCDAVIHLAAETNHGPVMHRVNVEATAALVLDLAKDMVKFRDPGLRYSLGMLKFRNVKLLGTGFTLPHGIKSALSRALAGARPG
jgi:NAD(P)-dependent dehydrogenase (short-subunit alcohol dehydrogenase family)